MTVQFRIRVDLAWFHIEGLKAVDFCRRFKMPESGVAYAPDDSRGPIAIVDEPFARKWFDKESTVVLDRNIIQDAVTVPHDVFSPGELMWENGNVVIANSISQDRLRDIFAEATADLRSGVESASRDGVSSED